MVPLAPSRRLTTLALGGASALVVLGAVSVWLAASRKPAGPAADEVVVTVSDSACTPMELTLPAGRTTFRIHNGSDRALEWEILDGVMVVAERENITPGLNATLTQALLPGRYQITCGLLSNPRGVLTVLPTAESTAALARPEPRAFLGALSEYRVYLVRRAAALDKAVAALADRIAAGDLEGARSAWLAAREPWQQMAPVSGRIADLANVIDPRAAYLDAREQDPAFTGFHRIEYGLWIAGSTEGLAAEAATLATATRALKDRLRALDLGPADLAASAADRARRTADEAGAAPSGYAHAELADFAAGLDGIAKAALLVDPMVAAADPAVSGAFHRALEATRARLDALRAGGAFPAYDSLPPAERQRLAADFARLAEAAAAFNPAIGLEPAP